MKLIIVYLLLELIKIISANDYLLRSVNHPETIEEINKKSSTWVAGENTRFNNMTLVKAQRLLGSISYPSQMRPPLKQVYIDENLPDNFDLRLQWPQCESIREIRDQSACGSCWAFATAEAISDRICIATNGQLQQRISADYIISCCKFCGRGCKGGSTYSAWIFWVHYGIPTGGNFQDKSSCQPYSFPPCDHHMEGKYGSCDKRDEVYEAPQCKATCQEGYPIPLEKDKSYGEKVYTLSQDEKSIMTEIFQHGSVEASMYIHEDFYNYKSGVYQNVHGKYLGRHSVKIIGWGVEKQEQEGGINYWLVVNSWNDQWGEQGTFRILRGSNHCNIESEIVAGIPILKKILEIYK